MALTRLPKQEVTIKEAARIFAISEDTLRFYEREGLLNPRHSEKNGYRLYGPAEFTRLSAIVELRNMGYSVQDIRAYCDNRTLSSTMGLLNTGLDTITLKVRQYETMQDNIIGSLQRYALALAMAADERVTIAQIPERRGIFVSHDTIHYDDLPYLFVKRAAEHGLPLSMFHTTPGYVIDIENVSEQGYYLPKTIFFITEHTTSTADYILPAGWYASITFRGSFLRSPEILPKLYAQLHDRGQKPAADPVEYGLISAFESDNIAEHVTRIEVLLR